MWMRLSRKYTFACLDEILTRTRVHSLADGPGTDQPILWRIRVLQAALARDTEWEHKYQRELKWTLGETQFDLGYYYLSRVLDRRRSRENFAACIANGYRRPLVWLYYFSSLLPGFIIRVLRRLKRAVVTNRR